MDIIAEKIEGSAGYSRSEMPQIDFDDLELTIAKLVSKGVGIVVKNIPAKRLKFTQNEIDRAKVQKKIKGKSKQYQDRLYFASRGWFVADGHHDLSQALLVAPNTKLTCFVCDTNIHELVQILNSFKHITNEDIEKALKNEKVWDKRGFLTTRKKQDSATKGGIKLKLLTKKDFEDIIKLAPEFGAPSYSDNEMQNISGERFNMGFCDVFAWYMENKKSGFKSHDFYDFKARIEIDKKKHNIEFRFPEHSFVSKTKNGKTLFFDIEEQNGVSTPFDLPFYKRWIERNTKTK